jgi:dipeptidase D
MPGTEVASELLLISKTEEPELKILDDSFEPKAVHDHFMELTTRYHPSGEENQVREYVMECARKIEGVEVIHYDSEAKDPGERVIVLRRKGSGDHASDPYVTLQAHMDMVCSPDKNIFPLKVFGYLDNEGAKWIKAGDTDSITDPKKGTTLGADDGIGVATILAILEDNNLKDYPIECFFTVQEETDMGGAANFDKSLLIGRKYINVDAEVVDTIIYGSAGGCNVRYEGNLALSSVPCGYTNLKLSISGLLGGHSGININSGRFNAIKVLTEILIRFNKRLTNLDVEGEGIKSYDLRLISLQRDEDPISNKIPSCASAIIAIPGGDKDEFVNDFTAYCEALKVQSQPEENLVYEIKEITQNSLDEASTDALLCLLHQIPHGVIHMIPGKTSLVETSSNLANIALQNMLINASNRSSDANSMSALIQMQKSIGELFKYSVGTSDSYPPWEPSNSDLLDKAQNVYKEIYHKEDAATVIHAGLECSYVVQKYDGKIDCISIGPTILNPHTGSECLKADTVGTFYNAVTSLIQELFQKSA